MNPEKPPHHLLTRRAFRLGLAGAALMLARPHWGNLRARALTLDLLRAGLSLPAYAPPDLIAQARPPGIWCMALDRAAAPLEYHNRDGMATRRERVALSKRQ